MGGGEIYRNGNIYPMVHYFNSLSLKDCTLKYNNCEISGVEVKTA